MRQVPPLSHSQVLQSIAHLHGLRAFTWFVLTGTASLVKAPCMSVPSLSQWRAWPLARYGRLRVPSTFIMHARAASTTLQPSSPPGCMRRHAHAAPRRRRQIARIWQVREPTQSTPPSTPSFASFTSQQNTRPICSDTLQRRQWPPRSGQHHYHCKAG